MRKMNLFFCVLFLLSFIFVDTACSQKISKDLPGAKGRVINILTNQPISNVEIVATTQSDIESDQPHLKYSTKTNKDGSFHIKGLPYKTYEIRAIKANYVAGKMEVVMPDKSNRIIEQPIELCPLPPGEGIFVYNDKYIRLSMKPFEVVKSTAEWSNVYIYLWRFAAKDLLDIPPVKSNYLILYGKFRGKYDEYNKMISSGGLALYYLYKSERVRQMLKKNWWERDTQQRSLANDYYSTGVSPGFTVLGQFYLGTGINRESYVNRPHKDNPDFFDGALQTKVFGDVVVVDIRVLPKGYYTIEMPEVDRSYLTNKSDQIQFVLNVE